MGLSNGMKNMNRNNMQEILIDYEGNILPRNLAVITTKQITAGGIIQLVVRDSEGDCSTNKFFTQKREHVMNHTQQMNSNDWRMQGQELYLNHVTLVFRDYSPSQANWEHDHCEFCGTKFSLVGDDLKSGYSTEDGYYWICNQCFTDFLHIFHWHVSPTGRHDDS
jgi:hypothetical protein